VTKQELFEILIRENERMVWAFLRGAADPADAQDIFQQACLVAWSSLDRYDRSRPFGPWLRGIAARLLLKHFRQRRASLPLDEKAMEAVEARLDTFGRLPGETWDAKLDSLRECLSRVNEEGRRLVDLYYRDGLSCEDISRRLGHGIETVKKRLQRLRLDLYTCLSGKLAEAPS